MNFFYKLQWQMELELIGKLKKLDHWFKRNIINQMSKGWWLTGIAHSGTLGSQKRSSVQQTPWSACETLCQWTWLCHVGSGVVLQKRKDRTLIPPSLGDWGILMCSPCSPIVQFLKWIDPLFQFPSFRQVRLTSSLGHPTSPFVHNCPNLPRCSSIF
jgi:hypothetical protein